MKQFYNVMYISPNERLNYNNNTYYYDNAPYLNLSTVLTALLTLCKRLSVGASSSDERTELIGRMRDAKAAIKDNDESGLQKLIIFNRSTLTVVGGWFNAVHHHSCF